MKRADAKAAAIKEAKRIGVPLALVREGPHADDFAEQDTDGGSYGFCPVSAVKLIYRYGAVIEEIRP